MVKKLLFITAMGAGLLNTAKAQSTYLQLGEDEYHLLDRLETKSGTLDDSLFLGMQPVSRKSAVNYLERLLQQEPHDGNFVLYKTDRYQMEHAVSISGEWKTNEEIPGDGNGRATPSKRPWFNTFYRYQPDFYSVYTRNFFLAVNPVISAQVMREQYTTGTVTKNDNLFASSRGVELRGHIANKIGFYTYVTDNQEQPNAYVADWIMKNQAVPGADYFQNNPGSKTYDYIQARGYIDFAIVKKYVTATMGYDKNFIGDGIRSLFLSDFSASSSFVKLNTKIWKLNYQNLYSEIIPPYERGADRQLPVKYSTTHYLSANVTRWLNLGLFENVIFQRADHYSFGYLNPIIFFRAIERGYGSPDNVNLGFSAKVIPVKGVQLYGQLFLDEFRSKELFGSKKWWGNKYGVQLGAKYFDAFTIKNLDLQAELNMVRPYAYSHSDSVTNYSHYNQPIAHPLGAGFVEVIGLANYRPVKNLLLTGKVMFYKRGVDTGGLNYGNDIFRSYNTLAKQYGVEMINGLQANCQLASLNASYKIAERLFFDLGFIYRRYSYENNYLPEQKSLSIYSGLRLNIARRAYDFM
ncbi:MAG: hypothetical protein JNL13_02410 [Chitinophagaceae bacterium]|nr:hypothetical protein [Chitinophagaceae bacterium]